MSSNQGCEQGRRRGEGDPAETPSLSKATEEVEWVAASTACAKAGRREQAVSSKWPSGLGQTWGSPRLSGAFGR